LLLVWTEQAEVYPSIPSRQWVESGRLRAGSLNGSETNLERRLSAAFSRTSSESGQKDASTAQKESNDA
jgi:hypothetical protein